MNGQAILVLLKAIIIWRHCLKSFIQTLLSWSQPSGWWCSSVLPLSSYVAILAQSACKLTQEIFRNYDKKVFFLFIQSFLSHKLMYLAQGHSWLVCKFVELSQLKIHRGSTGVQVLCTCYLGAAVRLISNLISLSTMVVTSSRESNTFSMFATSALSCCNKLGPTWTR